MIYATGALQLPKRICALISHGRRTNNFITILILVPGLHSDLTLAGASSGGRKKGSPSSPRRSGNEGWSLGDVFVVGLELGDCDLVSGFGIWDWHCDWDCKIYARQIARFS